MISLKTPKEIELLRIGGSHLAEVLDTVEAAVRPGITTSELNDIAEAKTRELGDTPAFLNYKPQSAPMPFPAALCVAVNDTVVHGIPNLNDVALTEGDIIGIDTGVVHEGLITDSGRTVPVGEIDDAAKKLLNVTREALMIGIKAAQPGNRVGDIGHAIEEYVDQYGYGIVDVLCGHGVGHKVHEDPNIPNFGRPGTGPVLKPGMVIAIEPMLNEGSEKVIFERDGYTVRTKDGKRSAHFEHTIAITEEGPLILTKR